MADLTPEDLATLKEKCARMTPGKMRVWGPFPHAGIYVYIPGTDEPMCLAMGTKPCDKDIAEDHDIAAIVALVNHREQLFAAVEEVQELRQERDQLLAMRCWCVFDRWSLADRSAPPSSECAYHQALRAERDRALEEVQTLREQIEKLTANTPTTLVEQAREAIIQQKAAEAARDRALEEVQGLRGQRDHFKAIVVAWKPHSELECTQLQADVVDRFNVTILAKMKDNERLTEERDALRGRLDAIAQALTRLGFTRPDGSLCFDSARCRNVTVGSTDVGEYQTETHHGAACLAVHVVFVSLALPTSTPQEKTK